MSGDSIPVRLGVLGGLALGFSCLWLFSAPNETRRVTSLTVKPMESLAKVNDDNAAKNIPEMGETRCLNVPVIFTTGSDNCEAILKAASCLGLPVVNALPGDWERKPGLVYESLNGVVEVKGKSCFAFKSGERRKAILDGWMVLLTRENNGKVRRKKVKRRSSAKCSNSEPIVEVYSKGYLESEKSSHFPTIPQNSDFPTIFESQSRPIYSFSDTTILWSTLFRLVDSVVDLGYERESNLAFLLSQPANSSFEPSKPSLKSIAYADNANNDQTFSAGLTERLDINMKCNDRYISTDVREEQDDKVFYTYLVRSFAVHPLMVVYGGFAF